MAISQATSPNSLAKLFFYYLVLLLGTGFTAFGAMFILFYHVDNFFSEESSLFDLRSGISLILTGILALAVSIWQINRGLNQGRIENDNKIRQWMTYIILACAAFVVLINFVVIFNGYLTGEFILKQYSKALIILVIAGVAFIYFAYDLMRSIPTAKSKSWSMGFVMWGLIMGIFISGIIVNPSPQHARNVKMDEKRIEQLQDLSEQIKEYHLKNAALPNQLSDLVEEKLVFQETIEDPETHKVFEYQAISPNRYTLCATFYFEKKDYKPIWSHAAGHQCIQQDVSSERNH